MAYEDTDNPAPWHNPQKGWEWRWSDYSSTPDFGILEVLRRFSQEPHCRRPSLRPAFSSLPCSNCRSPRPFPRPFATLGCKQCLVFHPTTPEAEHSQELRNANRLMQAHRSEEADVHVGPSPSHLEGGLFAAKLIPVNGHCQRCKARLPWARQQSWQRKSSASRERRWRKRSVE